MKYNKQELAVLLYGLYSQMEFEILWNKSKRTFGNRNVNDVRLKYNRLSLDAITKFKNISRLRSNEIDPLNEERKRINEGKESLIQFSSPIKITKENFLYYVYRKKDFHTIECGESLHTMMFRLVNKDVEEIGFFSRNSKPEKKLKLHLKLKHLLLILFMRAMNVTITKAIA